MAQTFTSFQEFKRRYPIRPNDQGSLLGSGSYGRVIKVEDQVDTEWVAIKISEFKGNDIRSLKAEVELAQSVPRQTNIARYDACHRLETDTSVSDFAIMKYYPDGNLADLLRHVTLTATQIYDITRGILLGLQHLHRHRIVHRDFKPANILISRDNSGRFIPKIADFGLSKLVSDDELDSSDFDLSDGRGTPSYKAPEQIEGSKVSFNLDLWAFGIILYEMLTGEKPFRSDLRNASEQSVRREIEKKIITVELPARLNQVREPYQSMIRRCLVRDIHKRARKETELLDLLDGIPQLMDEAKKLINHQDYNQAISVYEQVLGKREQHPDAEKGIAECKAALERQHIDSLLAEADVLIAQQQFEDAKSHYEQVLQLNPTQETAARGLAFCIERLRPKLIVTESELTDSYHEERTDVYVAPSVPIAVKTASKSLSASVTVASEIKDTSPTFQSAATPKVIITPPIVKPTSRAFPWKVVVPIAVAISGVAFYFNLRTTPIQQPSQNHPTQQRAEVVPTANPEATDKEAATKTETPKLKLIPNESKEALNKRINVALGKAKQAYQRKDFDGVVIMTNSALKLDPTRQDVAALRTAALKEIQNKASENATSALSKVVTPTPETEKLKPVEPTPKETPANAKQEAQNKYDQLIEDGQQAISKGNNKGKAIDNFTNARLLAKEQDLNTAKADAAYASYITTANRIFDRDELEGAKGWYQVAQALKDTEEVRRKIKQCTN